MKPEDFLPQLDEPEKQWWASAIKEFRNKHITEPKRYAVDILKRSWGGAQDITNNLDEVIKEVREEIYALYLADEAKFHAAILAHLFTERELPSTILDKLINHDYIRSISDNKLLTKEIGKLMGDYAGRIMPYIYELALSTTQSRRSRAGKTFEQLIESLLEHFGIGFDTQGSVSSGMFAGVGLGKKVDAIVPNIASYQSNRSKCAVVTMKTTLRERWQEVAEEISRTNVPHIYLLTVDDSITENVITTMKNYNISLVVYSSEKQGKFKSYENVYSFTDFFTKEMTHIMGYWK